MSQVIDAAIAQAVRALMKDVQTAVVRSRLTRWRDMFLVNRIVEDECRQYVEWGQLLDPLTLDTNVSHDDFAVIVERCLERIGEDRKLPHDVVEAAVQRAVATK